MADITLIFPGPEHEAAVLDYIAEHRAAGERELSGTAGLHRYACYGDWLAHRALERDGRRARPGWQVPGITYLALEPRDGRLIGMVNLRAGDSPKILDFDGHIGAGVRPCERQRGYGAALLRAGLEECRSLGLARALVTCDADNPASEAVIRRCGGVFEDARMEPHGNWVRRYWFDLG